METTPQNKQRSGTGSPGMACSPSFCLHGFTFETSEERQKAATSHPLWKQYLKWDRRRHCGFPDMDDDHDREVFEAYIEGAFQQFQENVPTLATRGLETRPENHAGDGQPSGLPAVHGSASSESLTNTEK